MKIIINQNKELRLVGYDENKGCNILDIKVYISKMLQPKKPVHLILDNHLHLLMQQDEENENYIIYKVFDLINLTLKEGIKNLKIMFNEKETKSIDLFFSNFQRNSLNKFLKKEE